MFIMSKVSRQKDQKTSAQPFMQILSSDANHRNAAIEINSSTWRGEAIIKIIPINVAVAFSSLT